jgi:hypothetical protein
MMVPKSRLAKAGRAMHAAANTPSSGLIFQKINQAHKTTSQTPPILAAPSQEFHSINHSHIHSRIKANRRALPRDWSVGFMRYYCFLHSFCRGNFSFR